MADSYSPQDGLCVPHIPTVRTEAMRFSFTPGEKVAERLWALTRPSYRNEMGRKGLRLYSDSSIAVTRRADGTLTPNEELMASELRKIVDAKPGNAQRPLARSIEGGVMRNKKTKAPLGVKVNLRVLLDNATALQIRENERIPDRDLLSGNGVNVGIFVPMRHVAPEKEFKQQYQALTEFMHGESWNPEIMDKDRQNPSLTLGAHVTNMRVSFH